jgi:hypothetical protein
LNLIKKEDVKYDSQYPYRSIADLVARHKPNTKDIENGAKKFQVAHIVSPHMKEDGIDVEEVENRFHDCKRLKSKVVVFFTISRRQKNSHQQNYDIWAYLTVIE